MKTFRSWFFVSLASLFFLGTESCWLPPPPNPTPCAPCGTPVPGNVTPTPTPPPLTPFQAIEGKALVRCKGIDSLPLSPVRDYVVCASFTWEMSGSDKSLPLVELSVRGTSPVPCASRPCGTSAGLVVRMTGNPKHDAGEPDEGQHCGGGVNYHRRLAIGALGADGGFDVELVWDPRGLHASTAIDSIFIPSARVPGSLGLGRFLVGAPFRHGERGFGWDELSINRFGGSAELLEYQGIPGDVKPCP